MKTLNKIILIALIAVILFDGIEKHSQTSGKIRNLEYQHTRDSLINDTLKSENADYRSQLGWYESQWSNLTDNGD